MRSSDLKSRDLIYLGATLLVLSAAVGCAAKTPSAAANTADAQAQTSPVAAPDPQNPLIGAWRLSGYTANQNLPGVTCTFTDLTFTATQATQAGAGGASTVPVTYIAGPTKVYVITSAGLPKADDYLVLDTDNVQLDALLGCKYHRVG
jgi:hypothetical protein